jgi:RimJ/RimL family protein N-acetyltransferase
MQTTVLTTRAGRTLVRPLRNGDTDTVQRVFDGLGPESRRLRFAAAKPRLTDTELEELARVDAHHHVLVAYIDGEPCGIAGLVSDRDDRSWGEIAVAVVDARQDSGVGTALVRLLVTDARAAGITHIRAQVALENRASLSVLAKATKTISRRFSGGGELEIVALPAPGSA